MGEWSPPFYGVEGLKEIIAKISKVDEKINELAIEREKYVAEFKKTLEKNNID